MQEAGVTLNSEKCTFSQKSVEFLGHVVDHTGTSPDLDKLVTIQKVRTPGNISDIRRFLGMVNQLSKLFPNLAEEKQLLRELLVKDREWVWGHPQQKAFDRIKKLLTDPPSLRSKLGNRPFC